MGRAFKGGVDRAEVYERPIADRPNGSLARGWRYRVFFVLPDDVEGRCELGQDGPITEADIDQIECALMARLGSSNACVIGWQRLSGDDRGPAAGRLQ